MTRTSTNDAQQGTTPSFARSIDARETALRGDVGRIRHVRRVGVRHALAIPVALALPNRLPPSHATARHISGVSSRARADEPDAAPVPGRRARAHARAETFSGARAKKGGSVECRARTFRTGATNHR